MLIQHTATAPTNTSEAIVQNSANTAVKVFITGSVVGIMEIHDPKAEY